MVFREATVRLKVHSHNSLLLSIFSTLPYFYHSLKAQIIDKTIDIYKISSQKKVEYNINDLT